MTNRAGSNKIHRLPRGLSTKGGLLGLLVLLYVFLQPIISQQLGIDLPTIPFPNEQTSSRSETHLDQQSPTAGQTQADSASRVPDLGKPSGPVASGTLETVADDSGKHGEEIADREAAGTTSPARGPRAPPSSGTEAMDSGATDLLYGILKSDGRQRYVSPAGLVYAPGSEEGHRLKHLERHTMDQPTRPGKHGVFDGGMETTLRAIDQAYQRALQGGRGITKNQDRDRWIYTVDMGSRVGYVGGREGGRQGKPMAHRIRIVVEDNLLITAYPL